MRETRARGHAGLLGRQARSAAGCKPPSTASQSARAAWRSGCRTMVSQLIKHERIETTIQKAKELRRVADQMVTLGKEVRG